MITIRKCSKKGRSRGNRPGLANHLSLLFLGFVCLTLAGAGVTGCRGDKTENGEFLDAGLDAAAGDGATDGEVDPDSTTSQDGGEETDSGWHSEECVQVSCQGKLYQCGDCIDNDGDGLIDYGDPNCLGPCDNNEGGFNTEIPGGDEAQCRLECYFDQDSGGGNDDCSWDLRCDDLEPETKKGCDHTQVCSNCDCDGWYAQQSQQCLDFCLPLVPNGCDCFGCCELEPMENEGVYRFIGSEGCSIDNIEACDPCTPVPSCLNECGHCEICIGKPELPPDCTEEDQCPEGVQPCGQPGQDPCPEGQFCLTGCCSESIIVD